ISQPVRLLFGDESHAPSQCLAAVLYNASPYEAIQNGALLNTQTCHDRDRQVRKEFTGVADADGPRSVSSKLALSLACDAHTLFARLFTKLLDPAATCHCLVNALG